MLHNPLFIETLTHLSRILRVADRFIPIYKDVKPLAKHLPNFFNKLSSISEGIKEKGQFYVNNIKNQENNTQNINHPTFFN